MNFDEEFDEEYDEEWDEDFDEYLDEPSDKVPIEEPSKTPESSENKKISVYFLSTFSATDQSAQQISSGRPPTFFEFCIEGFENSIYFIPNFIIWYNRVI